MKHDFSYGIIPVRIWRKQWQVLLVQHHAGHWAFPKGHAEAGESSQQAAERELLEETGLKVKTYLSDQIFNENYVFRHQNVLIEKKVQYFLALVSGQVILQQEEIQAFQWLALEQALSTITFKEGQKLCRQVIDILHTNKFTNEL